jgi:hypothetical protein
MKWERNNASLAAWNAAGYVIAVIVREKASGETCRAYDTHAPDKPIDRYGTVEETKGAVERHFASAPAEPQPEDGYRGGQCGAVKLSREHSAAGN